MAQREVKVAIVGDPSSLQRALRQSEAGLTTFQSRMQGISSRMRSVGSSLTRGLTLPLAVFGTIGVRELMAGEDALAQTQAVIESTGGAAQQSVQDILDLSAALQEMTSIDDEDIQGVANTLLTFRDIAGDTFDAATAATLDLSTAMHKDLNSSTVMVGKALNDPIRGLTSLTRVGVQFTEEQRSAITAMVAFGDTAGAQQIILEELNSEFGGSAEALGDTLSGRLRRVKQQFEEMGATIVEELLPFIEDLTDIITALSDAYQDLTPTQQKMVAWLIILAAVAGPLTTVIGGLAAVFAFLGGPITVIILLLAGIAAGLFVIFTHLSEVQAMFQNVFTNIVGNVPGARAAIEGMTSAVRTMWGAVQTATSVVRNIITMFKDLAGITFGGLVSAIDAIANAVNRVVGALGPAISLMRTLTSVAGSAASTIPSIPSGALAGSTVHESASFIPRNAPSTGRTGATPVGEIPLTEAGMRRIIEKTISPVVVVGAV